MRRTHKYFLWYVAVLTVLVMVGYGLDRVLGEQKQGWKPCKGLPPIMQTGPFSGNLKATPTNAPCYVDITAEAEGVSSAPIRIYIKK